MAPLDKQQHEKYSQQYKGVSTFLEPFEDPKDTPPPTRVETKDERKERKRKERAEQVAYKLEQDLAMWDPASEPNATSDPFKTLFVGRINYDTSESKLRREFEVYGPVKKITVAYNSKNGKPRGYAFVEYEHERDMHSAYKHADGKKIDGRRVLVDVERGRTIKGWRPRRLAGGLGGTRKGGPDVNTKYSGREDMAREDRSRSRERMDREPRDRDRMDRGDPRGDSRGDVRGERRERRRSRSRSRDKRRKRSRSRERRGRRSKSRDKEPEDAALADRRRKRSRSRERRRSKSRDRKRGKRSRSRDRRRGSRERRGGGEERPDPDRSVVAEGAGGADMEQSVNADYGGGVGGGGGGGAVDGGGDGSLLGKAEAGAPTTPVKMESDEQQYPNQFEGQTNGNGAAPAEGYSAYEDRKSVV